MLLIGRTLIGVAGRYGDPVNGQRLHVVKETADLRGVGVIEEGAIDIHPKTLRLRAFDRSDGAVVNAGLADGLVMHLRIAIQMNREIEIGRRLEQAELLFQQQRVGADRDDLSARYGAIDYSADLFVQERLPPCDHHDGSAAFIDCGQTIDQRQSLIEDLVGIIDLAATSASQVAAEQWLQHQHQRITLAPPQRLRNDIGANLGHLQQRNSHFHSLNGALADKAHSKGSHRALDKSWTMAEFRTRHSSAQRRGSCSAHS